MTSKFTWGLKIHILFPPLILGVWTWTFQKGSRGKELGGSLCNCAMQSGTAAYRWGRMLLSGTLNVEGVTCHEEWRP